MQEARPAGLTVTQLMAATERTRAQIHTGLAHLRQVAAARGLPPVTWDRKWGYRLLDDAPEVWIGYERAFFGTVHHRVANFIAGILLPHQTKTPHDPYIRTVMAQMGAIWVFITLMSRLARPRRQTEHRRSLLQPHEDQRAAAAVRNCDHRRRSTTTVNFPWLRGC
ncbi:hypothetical protein ACFWBB_15560 [Streptomyces sp. NPDC060000]|uniref:hypothetical protein n=1 Tax=Streptomyces sp. NPDC060000 TaxID=3347031 RepID=UPI0036B33437